jgi:hypothetical protein
MMPRVVSHFFEFVEHLVTADARSFLLAVESKAALAAFALLSQLLSLSLSLSLSFSLSL